MITLDKHGRYTAFGTSAHHSCFTKLPSTSTLPYRVDVTGHDGSRVFAFDFANTYLRTPPPAPTVKLCGK